MWWKVWQSSVFSERSSISLQRGGRDTHGSGGECRETWTRGWWEIGFISLELCTLSVVHSVTWDNCGHGWRHVHNKRLHFSLSIIDTPAPPLFSPHSFIFSIICSLSPQRPGSGKDELCCLWKQHLPGWPSESRFTLYLSLWTGAMHGCHGNRYAASILCQIMCTANVHRRTFPFLWLT